MHAPLGRTCGETPFGPLCGVVDDHLGGVAGTIDGILFHALWPLVLLAAVWYAARVARGIGERALERAGVDPQVRTLSHNVLIATSLAFALGMALWAVGVDLSVFLTVGGLSSLVVGLAFQDLLRNVLAGIFVLVERPFRIGDVIQLGDLTGSVAAIELRTTTLRLADGRLAIVPNLRCFAEPVVNDTAGDRRRYVVRLRVPDGEDLERLLAALGDELGASPDIADTPPPRILPQVDIDYGVTLECQYWLDWRTVDADAVQAELVRRVYAVAQNAAGGSVSVPARPRRSPVVPEEAAHTPAGAGRRGPTRLPRALRRRGGPSAEVGETITTPGPDEAARPEGGTGPAPGPADGAQEGGREARGGER